MKPFTRAETIPNPNPNLWFQCNLLLIRIEPFQCNLLLIRIEPFQCKILLIRVQPTANPNQAFPVQPTANPSATYVLLIRIGPSQCNLLLIRIKLFQCKLKQCRKNRIPNPIYGSVKIATSILLSSYHFEYLRIASYTLSDLLVNSRTEAR